MAWTARAIALYGRALDMLRRRKRSYQLCFNSPAGRLVLEDLMRFCRGARSTFHPDPRMAAALDGRREVLLRILNHLELTSEQLYELYGGRAALQTIEQENDDE